MSENEPTGITSDKPTKWWLWCYWNRQSSTFNGSKQGVVETKKEAKMELERRAGVPLRDCVEEITGDGAVTYYFHAGLPLSFGAVCDIARFEAEEDEDEEEQHE